jgi:phytoene dehydrogenase-like protein
VSSAKTKHAYVIGSGPNGLSAAIELARAGVHTTVIEAQPSIGGGAHSAEVTLPGFIHDVCSAVHPLGVSSPVFQSYPLSEHGLHWIHPDVPVAHPLDDGDAGLVERSVDATAARLGAREPYRRLSKRFARDWSLLTDELLKPFKIRRHPLLLGCFGMHALRPAAWEARKLFSTQRGRAVFAGLAAHSARPLDSPGSAAFGWVLGMAAHAVGWPIPRGGSQQITNALASYFQSLGGNVVTGTRVRSLDELQDANAVLCDVGPREFLRIAGNRLPPAFVHKLESYKLGPGAFKVDWALSEPVPWRNRDCARAGTVHVGGSLEDVIESERAPWKGVASLRPFVLFVQPTLFDETRAPVGKHIGWAYCHVPNGSTTDMTERIEQQVERFAPGFQKSILARHVTSPADFEQYNPNYTGGDILGGAQTLRQLVFRPTRSLYRTPLKNVYLCSASTPPGGGVHGICGYHAAKLAQVDMEKG